MSHLTNCSWRLADDVHDGKLVYRRPLGPTELGFYWDHVFYGVATTIDHTELEVEPGHEDAMFASENIERTWLCMKRRFPLVGASVDELPGSDIVEFVVDEQKLGVLRPKEINYTTVNYAEDATRLLDELQNGKPSLSNDVIAQLWVARERYAPRKLHAFIVAAHCITDGMANARLMREFCQELSSISREDCASRQPLAERLKTLVPLESLNPHLFLSLPRRRWREAAGKVIYNLRQSKLTGGHTLPTLPKLGNGTPARSRTTRHALPTALSQQIIRTCRALGITFGNALPVLSQLAYARILHRRRLQFTSQRGLAQQQPGHERGIGDAEWAHRTAQPMHFTGPLNMRPYLDKTWYAERGGAAEVCLAISFYFFTLPLMPSLPPPSPPSSPSSSPADSNSYSPRSIPRWLEGPRDPNARILSDDFGLSSSSPSSEFCSPAPANSTWSSDGAPPFGALLSRARFRHRAGLIRAQSAALLRHPLLHELSLARTPKRIRLARAAALAWRGQACAASGSEGGDMPNMYNRSPCVASNGGSSLGNRDLLFPYEYPLPPSGNAGIEKPRTLLRVLDTTVHLRCRPSELYLGALTTRGRLEFFSYADINVYDERVVREWMDEVVNAAVFYLGGAEEEDRGKDGGIFEKDAMWKARL